MLKIYIVEDDPIICTDLEISLKQFGYHVVGLSDHPDLATEQIVQLKPDLVLLDINLGGAIDGIKLANWLNEQVGTPFIFVTSYADAKTIELAKNTQPLGYIHKPFDDQQLHATIEIASIRINQKKELLPTQKAQVPVLFKYRNELLKITADQILYAEAFDNYCYLYVFDQQRYLLPYTLKQVEQRLEQFDIFFRVHRSFLVNLNRLEKVADEVVFIDSKEIPIGKTFRKSLRQKLDNGQILSFTK